MPEITMRSSFPSQPQLMHEHNPFTLSFGRIPNLYMHRDLQEQQILEALQNPQMPQQIFIITGLRGSGKTVLMTYIAQAMRQKEDWLVFDLNGNRDLLGQLETFLACHPLYASLMQEAAKDLSLLQPDMKVPDLTSPTGKLAGLSPFLTAGPAVTKLPSVLDAMLEVLTRKGKSVLVIVDEITPSPYLRSFACYIQRFIAQGYRIFFVMAGLHENIRDFKKDPALSFLYQIPRCILPPLDLHPIADTYSQIFHLEPSDAMEMAVITQGYAYAFQVLGYHTWKHQTRWKEALPDLDTALEEGVFIKIWADASRKEKKLLKAIAACDNAAVQDLPRKADMKSSTFHKTIKRLLKQQLIAPSADHQITLTLPRFKAFIQKQILIESFD